MHPGARIVHDWSSFTESKLERLLSAGGSFDGVGYLVWAKIDHSCLFREDLESLLALDLRNVYNLGSELFANIQAAKQRIEEAVATLRARRIKRVCVGVSWCDATCMPGASAWVRWYVKQFAEHFDVLPRVTFTPPPLTDGGTINAPPVRPAAYAEFLDILLSELGDSFGPYVELWNEWNLDTDWLRVRDPDFAIFTRMVAAGAEAARSHGKKVLLGGMAGIMPENIRDLAHLARSGLARYLDAVGFHDLRGTWGDQEPSALLPAQARYVRGTLRTPPIFAGNLDDHVLELLREARLARLPTALRLVWRNLLNNLSRLFGREASVPQVWLTEYGFPVVDPERRFAAEYLERIQVAIFAYMAWCVLEGSLPRAYWYTYQDFVGTSVRAHTTGWEDVLQYHYGDCCERGSHRLLGQLLNEGGPERVVRYALAENLFPLVDAASLGRRKPSGYRSNRT